MSDVAPAVDGAQAAPADNVTAPAAVEATQEPAPATDVADPNPPRDEKGRFVPQERVNEITRARRQAERERDHYRQELEALRSQAPQRQAAPAPDQPPTLEQYGYDAAGQAAYSAAMADWVEARAESRRKAREANDSRQKVGETFEQRAAEFAKTHPDFGERLSDLTSVVRLSPETAEVIGLSEHGPAIVYHLAQQLDVADRIARLPPHLAAAEIARLELKLSAPKPAATTRAPDPVPVLNGGSTPTKEPGRMSYEEYKRYRQGG